MGTCLRSRLTAFCPDWRSLDFYIVLLGNHGVLVVGKTVTDAMNKTEAAEAIAKALFLTKQLGGEVPLSDEECQFFLDLQKNK